MCDTGHGLREVSLLKAVARQRVITAIGWCEIDQPYRTLARRTARWPGTCNEAPARVAIVVEKDYSPMPGSKLRTGGCIKEMQ